MYHNVEILHCIGDYHQDKKYLFEQKEINGIKTLIVYYKNTRNPLLNFLRRMNGYRKGFSKLEIPDLVHANVLHNSMLFAVYLKKFHKIPFLVTEHWTALRKINSHRTAKPIKFFAKIIGNTADKILPVSKDLMYGLMDLGIKTKMQVIPNVVNTEIFFHGKHTKEFTFIHVSNLIPRKNADKIIDAAIRLLKNGYKLNLQIGGDGDEKTLETLRGKVEKASLSEKIEVFGIQTSEQIAERMQKSDCFILLSDDENQPCVIGEAFASGLRVISTNVGGIGEFFPPYAGILLDNTDIQGLEVAMKNVLGNPFPDAHQLVDYAEVTFSKKAIAKQISRVYEEILK